MAILVAPLRTIMSQQEKDCEFFGIPYINCSKVCLI